MSSDQSAQADPSLGGGEPHGGDAGLNHLARESAQPLSRLFLRTPPPPLRGTSPRRGGFWSKLPFR